jgi:hypothetical protein
MTTGAESQTGAGTIDNRVQIYVFQRIGATRICIANVVGAWIAVIAQQVVWHSHTSAGSITIVSTGAITLVVTPCSSILWIPAAQVETRNIQVTNIDGAIIFVGTFRWIILAIAFVADPRGTVSLASADRAGLVLHRIWIFNTIIVIHVLLAGANIAYVILLATVHDWIIATFFIAETLVVGAIEVISAPALFNGQPGSVDAYALSLVTLVADGAPVSVVTILSVVRMLAFSA